MKTHKIPQDGLLGLKENWRVDIISGFLVFLLALPLSLGIAKASEFPVAMGVLTAMIGGLVVGIFQGGRLTIKGPAAGLITVCSGAVIEMGGGTQGWQMACGVIVIAAVIQILLGKLKFGSLSDFFPHAAVHGMLAAIGIIILAKQLPVLLGVDPELARGLNPIELYTHLPIFITHAHGHIALVGVISLLILFGLPRVNLGFLNKIPAPVIVLLASVPIAWYWDFEHTEGGYSLVQIGDFWGSIGFNASFDMIGTFVFWKYVFMFLFVNSLESLLTVKAVDDLDPFRRKSDANKDLSAVGVGNGIAGMLGGLPMISEVVRSSANVNFGAKTNWSNVFHGAFLLLAMLLVIPLIEMIPNAALAAMLIFAGYRLASPKEFIGAYKIGTDQLVIFLVTIIVTVAEDLLLGVAAGILVKLIFHLINGASWKTLFRAHYELEQDHNTYNLRVFGSATFANFLSFKKVWNEFKPGKKVVMDFSQAKLVDHSFMEQLHRFEEDYHHAGGEVVWKGLNQLTGFSDHPLAARKLARESKNKLEFLLNKRQVELRQFADYQGFTFYPQKMRNSIKYRQFPIMRGSKFQYEENMMITYTEAGKLEISDLIITENSNAFNTAITVLNLTETRFNIPDFALEPENLATKLEELTLGKDIDFSEHASFSTNYYLHGHDEKAIRQFFTSEVIAFFESHPGLCLESSRNKLLVYTNKGLLSPIEMVDLIGLIEQFVQVVEASMMEEAG